MVKEMKRVQLLNLKLKSNQIFINYSDAYILGTGE